MKLLGYLLVTCMSFSVAAQAGFTRMEDHMHVAHPHSAPAHDDGSAAQDVDHDHDFDHAEVSETEYSHRHTPDGPVHQHKTETSTVAQTVGLPAPLVGMNLSLPVHAAIYLSTNPELTSLEICPPRRPPRA